MILDKIIKTANANGDKAAVVTRRGIWTYKELVNLICEVYEKIKSKGLQGTEPVGIAFHNCVEFIASLLACAMAGNPAVLLSTAFKSREMKYHIENTGVSLVLASPSLRQVLSEAGGIEAESFLPSIKCWQFQTKVSGRFEPGDFMCQLTSGTNGMSKAVVRTQKAVSNEVFDKAEAVNLKSGDHVLIIPPIYHSYCFGGMLAALCTGCRLTLVETFLPQDVIGILENDKVSVMFGVPIMYSMMNRVMEQRIRQGKAYGRFPDLRLCFCGGAPLSKETLEEYGELFDNKICHDYGSTETGAMCLNFEPGQFPDSVGKPIGGRIIKAFDENGMPLAAGETGELRIKSSAVLRRYIYPDELNDNTLKGEWYLTGDFGRVDGEGNVYITGRKSNIINVAGLKVDPVEIEDVISQLSSVKEVSVVGVDSDSSGQVIKAFIVPAAEIDEKEVIYYCRKHLADFKVPRAVEFIDELPRSQTGKVLKKQLIFEEGVEVGG